jgi:dTDP-4-amino-4,6-dideoxygalactose transaminase
VIAGHSVPDGWIPFNLPGFHGREAEYVAQVMAGGRLAGDGPFTKRCHDYLESALGVAKCLLTTSCTSALEMSALLLDIRPGDEVIMPAFTFVSTANAFVLRGARPVFADIRPDTLNLDESQLDRLITPRTRAIVLVHYAGVGCEMDEIAELAASRRIPVIEDNAHGLFGRYKGRFLGTFGALATLSFHETKNFTCGEGGAQLINDPSFVERAEIIREKGTDRTRFYRGEVDKYSWVDIGSSYLPSDLLAALLLGQLEARERIQALRRLIWERYEEGLQGWARSSGVALPVVPPWCDQAYHMFYLLMPSLEARQGLLEHLKQKRISGAFHYLPLHLSKMGRMFGSSPGQLPVSESTSDRLVRLPLYSQLSELDQERVLDAVVEYRLAS